SMKLIVQGAPVHTSRDPMECAACSKAINAALKYVIEIPKPGEKGCMSYQISRLCDPFFAGWAYIASGRHIKQLEWCVKKLSDPKFYKKGGGNGNWYPAMAAMFLSEIYKRYPTEKTKNVLIDIIEYASQMQEPTGGWNHRKGFVYPVAGGGKDISIITSIIYGAMLNMKYCGIPVPEDTFKAAGNNLIKITDGAGLSYGTGNSVGDRTMGRACWMYLALHSMRNIRFKYARSIPQGVNARYKNTDGGHAYPPLHYASVAMTMHLLGPRMYNKFASYWINRMIPLQKANGSVLLPNKENMGTMEANQYVSSTAVFALILLLQKPGALERDIYVKKKVRSIGSKPASKPSWLGVRVKDDVLGVKVTEVLKDSPASAAGVKAGDYLLEINGIRPGELKTFRKTTAALTPGTKTDGILLCPKEKKSIQITPSELPNRPLAANEL
ncbi:PDZ domain-containing protein, partial [Planctomycetota bacterium]